MIDITGFIITILPIALSPGTSFTLAISNIAIAGLRGVLPVILGSGVGIVLHATLVGLGVSTLIANNPQAMYALHLFGIAFLGWLGFKLLFTGIQAFHENLALNHRLVGFKQALLLNLINARAIVLYLTVTPIFAGNSLTGFIALGLVHVAMLACWILLAGSIIIIARRKIKLNLVTGVINFMGGTSLLAVTLNMIYANFLA
ncbi:LysE family transporter [Reinekea marina]|uniref:LysE family translocator n=1 Tax=Reinekea marina TaxID=1310421 RepID=A0ABV7WVK2_9GAMM|nr:LysE family transporter [Reinekea marina]MDN3650901.1 LysE family transporter [Reinekea marina]